VLERLTGRLALAENDRDAAIRELTELRKRFNVVEGELQKKRAELRELLRQEVAAGRATDSRNSSLELLAESAVAVAAAGRRPPSSPRLQRRMVGTPTPSEDAVEGSSSSQRHQSGTPASIRSKVIIMSETLLGVKML